MTRFFIIFRAIFRPMIRVIGLTPNMLPFYNAFWSVTSTLISSMGIFPVLRLLWAFRGVVLGQTPLESLNNHGTEVQRLFVTTIRPFWAEILVSRSGVLNLLYIVMSTTLFWSVRPISMFLLRTLFTLIVSSLGIFWSETLRTFTFLWEYANVVRDFLKPLLTLPIPKELEPTYLQMFGVFCLGVIGIAGSLVGIDLYWHDLISNFPFLDYLVEWCYYALTPLARCYRLVADFIRTFRGGGGPGRLGF